MDDRTASALRRPLENLHAGVSSAGQDAAAFPINKSTSQTLTQSRRAAPML
jgi:hypothetical protein